MSTIVGTVVGKFSLRRACLAAIALVLAGCNQELYHGLTEKDANEMIAVLQQHGVNASRELADGGTYKLLVDEGRFADSVTVLKRAGYPKETYRSIADVFPGDGLVTTPFEQRARMVYALDQELANTLSQIDGIVNARVHVVLADADSVHDAASRPTASIVAIVRPGIDKSDIMPKIRQIVSNSVAGLNFKDVAVAFFTMNGLDQGVVGKAGAGGGFAAETGDASGTSSADGATGAESGVKLTVVNIAMLVLSAGLLIIGVKIGLSSVFAPTAK